jgi:hypothetical protein
MGIPLSIIALGLILAFWLERSKAQGRAAKYLAGEVWQNQTKPQGSDSSEN